MRLQLSVTMSQPCPEIINKPALFNSDGCLRGSALAFPFLILHIVCHVSLILIPSVIDELSISHVLAMCCDHSFP